MKRLLALGPGAARRTPLPASLARRAIVPSALALGVPSSALSSHAYTSHAATARASELLAAYAKVTDADLAAESEALHQSQQRGGDSSREIFANSTDVHLDKMAVIGFDYDYTLASYTHELQRLIYRKARDHLVGTKRYPLELLERSYDKRFAIRGLTFDTEKALLFKLSPSYRVDLSCVFKGRQRLTRDEALAAFDGNSHVRRRDAEKTLRGIFDQFSLAEANLLSDVCQHFFERGIDFSPGAVFTDVTSSIRFVHTSKLMHRTVMVDVERYLHHTPRIRQMVEMIRASGKQTFLLSNSSFDYVDAGMRYICGDDWMALFDVVATDSDKPSFYSGNNPFRQIDLDSASKLDPTKRINWAPVTALRQGAAYSKGNVSDLMAMTGWQGTQVLYIGDHLFADLRGPARFYGWWTGAIIRELESELVVERSPQFRELALRMQLLEELMRRVQWAKPFDVPGRTLADVLDDLEARREDVRRRMNLLINANFGSVFSSSNNAPSLFAAYMTRYSDLYSARLENLLDYGMGYRFYPRKKGKLPHSHSLPAAPVKAILQKRLAARIAPRDVQLKSELSFADSEDDDDHDDHDQDEDDHDDDDNHDDHHDDDDDERLPQDKT